MDKNTILGFILIFGILLVWNLTNAPDRKQMEQREQAQLDSLRQLEQRKADSLAQLKKPVSPLDTAAVGDTLAQQQMQQQFATQFGAFAPSAAGTESFEVLENNVMRIIFASKGGRIKEVELKEYFKVHLDSNHKEIKQPLKLLEDEKNQFEYLLPVAGLANPVSTSQLYFQPVRESNSLIFRADAGQGRFFEQVYTLAEGSYAVQYSVRFSGLDNVLNREQNGVKLHWVNFLDKLEQNHNYERNYSTVYYKPTDDSYDYCNCTGNDTDELTGKPVKWVAHSNQFFASVLYAKEASFRGAVVSTEVLAENEADLKKLSSDITLPLGGGQSQFDMELYLGPKKFENLVTYKSEMEDIIPFGSNIIGTANRWVIRPLFNFLSTFIGIKGIVILVLTLIVKLLLYPLSYKMLYSQSKMLALKPQLTGLREKYKEDQATLQMETMKIYREFGVNPLGGCLPVLLQMPVWLALYRFFPASIEFRQANFLWATDLSSYDAAFWLPFNIPFYGQHVSLFTLLWVVTTLWYTYYNMKTMDMSAMGQNAQLMKWMQYLMPIFFLFFFNNFASGLTVYLVFSNLLNVFQTVATKKWVISEGKIKAELEAYRAKPKKKGGFQAKLEEAMKQQQAITAQREAAAKAKQQPKKK